ncbi:MAG: hypothetical protein J0I21_11405 [Alphaproteobacteria bacterium]|nr:hypothetical protein [Alphaproteobacteria bacterium]
MRPTLLAAAALALAMTAASCAPDAGAPLTKVYLEQARGAIARRDSAEALAALACAQSVWISRNVPFTTPFFNYDPEALRAIARAQQSIEMGRWDDAGYYTRVALGDPSILTPGWNVPPHCSVPARRAAPAA